MRPNGFNFYIADGGGVIAQYDLPAAYNVDKLTYDQERRLQVGNSFHTTFRFLLMVRRCSFLPVTVNID